MTPTPKGDNFGVKLWNCFIFFKIIFSTPEYGSDKQAYSKDDQGMVYQIVNFLTHGAGVLMLGCGHISHIVKMHNFLENLFLCSCPWIRQNKFMVIMLCIKHRLKFEALNRQWWCLQISKNQVGRKTPNKKTV